MWVFTLDLIFTLRREFRTSSRVPTELDGGNVALPKCDLSVHDFDRLSTWTIFSSQMINTRYLDAPSILLMTSGLPCETGMRSMLNE